MKKLVVYNVGHGNWNEVEGFDKRIFYDIGACKYSKENDIKVIIDSVSLKNGEKIILIISHWDVDHYHCILKMDDKELQKILKVYAPEPPYNPFGQVPNTIKNVLERLEENNVPIVCVPKPSKTNISSRKIELKKNTMINIHPDIELYRTTGSKNKNLDSIVLYIEGSLFNVSLTGDNYYNKLYEFILNRKNGRHVIVIPHHGGNAGTFRRVDWNKLSIEAVICSWGKNTYNHNLVKTNHYFNSTVSKGKILDTKSMGTVSYNF